MTGQGHGQIERTSGRQAPSSSSSSAGPSQQAQAPAPSMQNMVMPVTASERPTGPPSMVGAGALATGNTINKHTYY